MGQTTRVTSAGNKRVDGRVNITKVFLAPIPSLPKLTHGHWEIRAIQKETERSLVDNGSREQQHPAVNAYWRNIDANQCTILFTEASDNY